MDNTNKTVYTVCQTEQLKKVSDSLISEVILDNLKLLFFFWGGEQGAAYFCFTFYSLTKVKMILTIPKLQLICIFLISIKDMLSAVSLNKKVSVADNIASALGFYFSLLY